MFLYCILFFSEYLNLSCFEEIHVVEKIVHAMVTQIYVQPHLSLYYCFSLFIPHTRRMCNDEKGIRVREVG